MLFIVCLLLAPQGITGQYTSLASIPFYTFGSWGRYIAPTASGEAAKQALQEFYSEAWSVALLRIVNVFMFLVVLALFVLSLGVLCGKTDEKVLKSDRLRKFVLSTAIVRVAVMLLAAAQCPEYLGTYFFPIHIYVGQLVLLIIYFRSDSLQQEKSNPYIGPSRVRLMLLPLVLLAGSWFTSYGMESVYCMSDDEAARKSLSYNVFQYPLAYSAMETWIVTLIGVAAVLSIILLLVIPVITERKQKLAFFIQSLIKWITIDLGAFTVFYCLFSTLIWKADISSSLLVFNRVFAPGPWMMTLFVVCGYLYLHEIPRKKEL
ncbi:MAG: hypothetical protein E7269_08300 [Lachnospiraceae bacterium]|nr:hypothetical protein [Lachnospiraceae bacterium]